MAQMPEIIWKCPECGAVFHEPHPPQRHYPNADLSKQCSGYGKEVKYVREEAT